MALPNDHVRVVEPEDAVRVVVVPTTCDYQIVLDNAGTGTVLATCDTPAAAMRLAVILRTLSPEDLADLWERA
jgi:hypothetical protein